jgi:hypothetical protein
MRTARMITITTHTGITTSTTTHRRCTHVLSHKEDRRHQLTEKDIHRHGYYECYSNDERRYPYRKKTITFFTI